MNKLDATAVIKELTRLWGIDKLQLIAEYKAPTKGRFGSFEHPRANDREVYYPKTEGVRYGRDVFFG